ncbi:alternative ribosome rescue aminoacyl-tRNA hydrolase ArfB [Oceanicaulis sp. MMSF_3324]|uniref:alternative ribosome rescue aminoacyl-tRNA hydrolase ArfB n=1 Tax=Oceanicaulis sp. MMSF_3324 TaxID=3046702 RepID=UPI0027400AA6|nr:alternative ribosome rescue aminoacyl-tRNA hydrolase ArfB [Oceanicaulis sp. MMSF_3324]
MRITDELIIDESLITERFVRSSGPGGQHVNKTESAVQLRFDVNASALPDALKQRLKRIAGNRMTQEGVLVLHVEDHRSQERNRAEARTRLKRLIEQASRKPKPRLKSRPSLNSIKRQKDKKAKKSQTKSLRQKPRLD